MGTREEEKHAESGVDSMEDLIRGAVVPRLAGEDAGGVLLLLKLMAVECVLLNDQQGSDRLLLPKIGLSPACPLLTTQAAGVGRGQGLGGAGEPAGLEPIFEVNDCCCR